MIAVSQAAVATVSAVHGAAVRLASSPWVLAQPGDPDPSTGHGPEWGKAAPAGLLIWLFMGAALLFLIKSMNRHMKRIPKSFDDAAGGDGPAAPRGDEAPAGGGAASADDGAPVAAEVGSARGEPAARPSGAVPAADQPE